MMFGVISQGQLPLSGVSCDTIISFTCVLR